MRRVMVVAGFCVLAAIAVVAVVGRHGGSGARAPGHATANRAQLVYAAAVTRSRRGTPRVPQVPGGHSCFVTASPAGVAGADQCGGQACAEFIASSRSVPPRRHVLVLGSRCPAQAVLRGERAHPGLRTPRSTAR